MFNFRFGSYSFKVFIQIWRQYYFNLTCIYLKKYIFYHTLLFLEKQQNNIKNLIKQEKHIKLHSLCYLIL